MPATAEAILFAIVALLNLVITTPGILLNFRSLYHVIFITGLAAILLKRNIGSLFLSSYYRPIALCLCLFSIFWLNGYSERNSVLTFLRGTLFFVSGFALASKPQYYRLLLLCLCLYLLFLARTMKGGITAFLQDPESREAFTARASVNLGLGQGESFKEVITSFVWHISLSAILVIALLDSPRKRWSALAVVFVVFASLLFCISSLYTAPLMMILAGIACVGLAYGILNRGRRMGAVMKAVTFTPALIWVLGFIIVRVMGGYTSSEGTERFDRFQRIVSMPFKPERDQDDLDAVTSGRVSLGQESWRCFLSNPLLGVGDFPTGINLPGGHNAALDVFARYGLLGGIPVVFLFSYCLATALRAGRLDVENPWTMASCLAFLIVYTGATFGNPIFLTAISETLFFLVFGFVAGRHALLAHRQRIPRTSKRPAARSTRLVLTGT
jgi:hypothetical protein